jgi:hypothetical protein
MPNDLILVWEDYGFMVYCQTAWNLPSQVQATTEERDKAHRILSEASPSLIRILQAVFLTFHPGHVYGSNVYTREESLSKIHTRLDVSWDELRTVICSVRPLIGDKPKQRFIQIMSIVALDQTLFPSHFDSLLWDLASGSLHVFWQVVSGELSDKAL